MNEETKHVLETLIAVYLVNPDYKTIGPAFNAHLLLTGKTPAEADKDDLRELYPELVRGQTLSEKRWEHITAGKVKPIAIWNKSDAEAYYAATEQDQKDWNTYAQSEADKFQDTLDAYETIAGCTGHDRDGNVTPWCPPMWFPEWLAQKNSLKNH